METDIDTDFEDFIQSKLTSSHSETMRSNSAVICLATPGTPVIYVSDAFEEHTGYTASEIIGKSLNILQGPASEPEAIEKFRYLIQSRVQGFVKITNYRKDGTEFIHECEMRPVFGENDEISHFIAIQRPCSVA